MVSEVMFSSKKDDWRTPKVIFDEWNKRYSFTLDAAASEENALCPWFFDAEMNALEQSWEGERVWCNPPYVKGELVGWVRKFAEESQKGCLIVALLPCRIATAWFREWVQPYANLFVYKGRIKFEGAKDPAPFESLVAVYNGVGNDWVKW